MYNVEFFLRLNDPLNPVYAVDLATKTYKVVASRIGVVNGVAGNMPDGGAIFRGDGFARVWPVSDVDGRVRYTRKDPSLNKEGPANDPAGSVSRADF